MITNALKFPKYIQAQIINLGVAKSFLVKAWPFVAIVTAHSIWGINFIVAKVTLQEIPLMSLAFLRFALALLLILPFLLVEKNKTKIAKKDLPTLVAIGMLMVTLNIALFYAGVMRTTAISASVLTMVIPMISVLGGWWFLKEKIYTANLVGVSVGLLGAALVVGLPLVLLGTPMPPQASLGNLLVILASVCWVIGAIMSKKMLEKYSSLTITTIMFAVGLVTFLIPALNEYFQNPHWYQQVTYLGLSGLLFISVASSICAYFLFEWGLSKLGVIKADLFQYIEPIIATVLGVFVLNEGLRFSFVIGALLIALGVYWSTIGKEHHKHHKAHRV